MEGSKNWILVKRTFLLNGNKLSILSTSFERLRVKMLCLLNYIFLIPPSHPWSILRGGGGGGGDHLALKFYNQRKNLLHFRTGIDLKNVKV